MAHIRKLRNGKYQAIIYIGKVLDLNGKPKYKYKSFTCISEMECKRKAIEFEYKIKQR